MCLAIPMQIIEVNGFVARCNAKGVERDVNLFLLQNDELEVGDFVMVHVGYAIQKVTKNHALSSWELYEEMMQKEAEHNA